jgi:hypothetical protein
MPEISTLRNAQAFLIYRLGKSLNWDCTVADISRELGIDRWTVAELCRVRGYPVAEREWHARGPQPVDHQIKTMTTMFGGNRV